ncbi:MAG: DUF4399 domain-containing protein [Pseudomonadota bacterium]
MKRLMSITAAALFCVLPPALAGETPSPAGAKQYFVNLKDGDTVSGPVHIVFGLKGMGVAPAGVEVENTGHHHVLINRPPLGQGEDGAEEFEFALPADDNHKHYGKGQTETTLELPAGTHTLQLVLGDWSHVPHNPPVMSDQITITVE